MANFTDFDALMEPSVSVASTGNLIKMLNCRRFNFAGHEQTIDDLSGWITATLPCVSRFTGTLVGIYGAFTRFAGRLTTLAGVENGGGAGSVAFPGSESCKAEP